MVECVTRSLKKIKKEDRMPKKVDLSNKAFFEIKNWLVGTLKYRQVGKTEFQNDFERLGLVPPRPRKGREVGFVLTLNGYTAKVWPTYDILQGKFIESDAAWFLICQGDNALYFSGPIHRTEHFVQTLVSLAWVGRIRLENWPLCPEEMCRATMQIGTGKKNLKQKYLYCPHKEYHLDSEIRIESWDYGMPWQFYPKAHKFVLERRKRRARWYKKLKQDGKEPNQAMKRRKRWRITKPQNIRPV